MPHEPAQTATSGGSPRQPEVPTDRATLEIRSTPLDMTLSGQGTATTSVVLGVIGPAATIAVGTIASFPPVALTGICIAQIAAAYLAEVIRRRRT